MGVRWKFGNEVEGENGDLPKRFYKYEIRFFDTKQNFLDSIATPLNLQENIDYEIVDNNSSYLMFGDDYSNGGSNLVNENNLPFKEYLVNISSLWVAGGFNDSIPKIIGGTNVNVNEATFSSGYDIQGRSGVTGTTNKIIWNYGSKSQKEFLPKYKKIFAVKFLKDIK